MDLPALSDLAERIANSYADAHGLRRYSTWHLLRLQDEAQELAQSWVELTGQRGFDDEDDRRSAFASDLADVLVQTLVLARQHGIDLETEVRRQAEQTAPAPA